MFLVSAGQTRGKKTQSLKAASAAESSLAHNCLVVPTPEQIGKWSDYFPAE